MKLQRVWLIENKSGNFVSKYTYDEAQKFGLNLQEDAERAISLVTDHTDVDEFKLRLFQAVIRHPAPDSNLITFNEAISAYEIVRRFCSILTKDVDDSAVNYPSTTQLIGTANYDVDAFGASRQIDAQANRCVDLSGDISQRDFTILDARACVDAATGQFYPGITVAGTPENWFWALPDVYLHFVQELQAKGKFPLNIEFSQDEDGTACYSIDHQDRQ